MKFRQLIIGMIVFFCASSYAIMPDLKEITVHGTGATFPYFIYLDWSNAYQQKTNISVYYLSTGSEEGIERVSAKLVDFGGSDMPLTMQELNRRGLVQFPAIIGGIVPIINLKSIKNNQLKLSGSVLADIYLGKITFWDDPKIQTLNPNLKLPHIQITVMHRADGSGTSFIFTHYLTQVNADWAHQVGYGVKLTWPTGAGIEGNEGMAAIVRHANGSIGYVGYTYALQGKLTMVQLLNKDQQWVSANLNSFEAAARSASWSADNQFNVILNNQAGPQSWPIVGASFILVPKLAKDPTRTVNTLKFFAWAFKNGGATARKLNYVPLPDNLVSTIEQSWRVEFRDSANKPIWSASVNNRQNVIKPEK